MLGNSLNLVLNERDENEKAQFSRYVIKLYFQIEYFLN